MKIHNTSKQTGYYIDRLGKKTFVLGLFLLCVIVHYSCQEEIHGPNGNGIVPPQVSGVQVENLPGAARISYDVPPGRETLYVAAECTLKNGQVRQAKSTFYTNTLVLEGFGDTDEYEVNLYSVGQEGQRSDPVAITVKPLTPPVQQIFGSLNITETFGGVVVAYENDHEADVAITMLTTDDMGDWTPVDVLYTASKEGRFTVRGFSAEERLFAVSLRDRWDNHSDTLARELIPLHELEIPKPFTSLDLPTDASHGYSNVITRLWDNSLTASGSFRTATGAGLPHHYSFDLGVTTKLSRYVVHQRGLDDANNDLLYTNGNLLMWEVWGSNNPSPFGDYEGWEKLLVCTSHKPSGLPVGQISNEDLEYARRGEEYDFETDAPPVRYIRIKVLQTWNNADFSNTSEMTFYGDY